MTVNPTRTTRGGVACLPAGRYTARRTVLTDGVSPDSTRGPTPAAVERAVTTALLRAGAAYEADIRWEQRVRAALSAVLDLFEARPELARLCVLKSGVSGPAALALREQALAVLALRIDDGRGHAPRQPPPHAAQAVLAGVIGAIRARLMQPGPGSMSDLLDPLTSFIVLPYRGAGAARCELGR